MDGNETNLKRRNEMSTKYKVEEGKIVKVDEDYPIKQRKEVQDIVRDLTRRKRGGKLPSIFPKAHYVIYNSRYDALVAGYSDLHMVIQIVTYDSNVKLFNVKKIQKWLEKTFKIKIKLVKIEDSLHEGWEKNINFVVDY